MSFDLDQALESVAAVAREHAPRVDGEASFPKETVDAARGAGLLGLTTATEMGGKGLGLREAARVIERIAQECGSSAMVLTMHYAGNAVLEAHGSEDVRRAVGAGGHLSTLAFSESGTRSHFWAPLSTARNDGDEVVLDAKKSWITSADHADGYVWSSQPADAEGMSTIWLVPRDASGLKASGGFDGIGLRGNNSLPVAAEGARIPAANRLGADGAGFDVMMTNVLPTFCTLIAAGSIGMAEAAVRKTAEHAAGTKYAHMDGTALSELPTIRAYVAKMRIRADQARALWNDTVTALEEGRPDAMLRVLQVKASSADAATEILDTAMRVCGGQAFRKDVGVERRFRDGRAALVMAPTSDQLYDFIGKAVCGMDLF